MFENGGILNTPRRAQVGACITPKTMVYDTQITIAFMKFKTIKQNWGPSHCRRDFLRENELIDL